MDFKGVNFTGYTISATGKETFQAFAPAADDYLPGKFSIATKSEFDKALALAQAAFPVYSALSTVKRAEFLEAIANEIMALGDILIERASAESGLPIGRITGERGRTCGQLKLFAQLIRDGWYVDARIDTAQPDRQPMPRSDIRRMLIPIGPVAVFGASNFPLAFSTAGGDTASALAAGCPVIVKAHPSHPGTHELVCNAIIKASQRTNMPEGVFSALYLNNDDAIRLVQHPVIKAVGFTGSRGVGMKLYNAAQNRLDPIPVYAEMSAVNPVIMLPNAIQSQADKLAKDLAGSVTLGVGQFCTNPGLVLVVNNESAQSFLTKLGEQISAINPAIMLNKNICKAYNNGVAELENSKQIRLVGKSATKANNYQGQPMAFSLSAEDFITDKKFSEEVFGPVTLVVLCNNEAQLIEVINGLDGQLTATIHAAEDDKHAIKAVVDSVTQKAGRVIYGGYPTGVEVSHAMQHGGPFPSTTDARSTSVGTAAVYRFLRPVAFQDLPDEFLPDALKKDNQLNILRLLDGQWTTAKG